MVHHVCLPSKMPPFYPQLMHSHEFEMRHRHIGLLDPHMVHHVCLPSKTPPFYSQVLLSYLLEMRHLPLHIGLLNRRITHHLYQAKCLPFYPQVMHSYEFEMRHPLRNLLMGQLVRSLLIQVRHPVTLFFVTLATL